MTDIVERLRTHDDARLYVLADLLMAEAADEIERNRAAIAELVGALQDMMEYAGIIEERCDSVATDAARAAITKHTTTTKEGN